MDLNQIALPPVFACKWLAICRGMSFYFTSACAWSCPVLDPQTLKTNPMCFTALTERILAGLRCEQGCDFCQHVCVLVSHVIIMYNCSWSLLRCLLSQCRVCCAWVFFFLMILFPPFCFLSFNFFSLFLSGFVSQCDQVQVIPIPSVCIIFFILRACLCIYFHLLRETCLT